MYLGNQPALNYTSLVTQTFTVVTGQTQYSLDHSVANGNDILLYIANVKQVEGSGNSYTASGNTLTLNTSILAGTEMYCLYLSKAIQTVNPPNASVGTSQLASSLDLSSKTITLASNMTNTPAFAARLSANFTVPSATNTLIPFDVAVFNEGNCFNTSTNRFTAPSAGKYLFSTSLFIDDLDDNDYQQTWFFKNGSRDFLEPGNSVLYRYLSQTYGSGASLSQTAKLTNLITLEQGDYIQVYGSHNQGAGQIAAPAYCTFSGFKLIG